MLRTCVIGLLFLLGLAMEWDSSLKTSLEKSVDQIKKNRQAAPVKPPN
jgi:hypothetical protein